jgi:hypothetical protein
MSTPPIVSPEAWEAAHQQMLVKEKAAMRAHDALAAERRRMPWVLSRAPQARIAHLKARRCPCTPSTTASMWASASMNITATTCSSATAVESSALTSSTGAGDEAMGTVWSYLDITPLGRQEIWEDSPEGYPQTQPYKWWNWHDNYTAEATPHPKWVEVSDAEEAVFRSDSEAKACTCS